MKTSQTELICLLSIPDIIIQSSISAQLFVLYTKIIKMLHVFFLLLANCMLVIQEKSSENFYQQAKEP